MCIDFDGHHSGGSSFDLDIYIWYFDYVIRYGPYPQVQVLFKKKKNQVKSPSPESCTPNSVRISQSGRTRNRSVTLFTVDLRVMDMLEFNVILEMDWLTAYIFVIDCERRRVTAYTQDGTRVIFQGEKHSILPQTVYESRCHGQLASWIASLTLEDEVRPNLDLYRVVCEYEDVFPDELPGLPPQRVVDFGIELHPSTSPISMTLHRMAPVEL